MVCYRDDKQFIHERSINDGIGKSTYQNSPIILPNRRTDAGAFSEKRRGSLNFGGERKPKPRNLALLVSRGFMKLAASVVMKLDLNHFKE